MNGPEENHLKLGEYARGADALTVVAPFVKVPAAEWLLDQVSDRCRVDLFTRWHAAEVVHGVHDLEVFDLIDERGGRVWLHPRVHAKAYLRSGADTTLVGSSNLSSNGLGLRDRPAVELLCHVPAGDPDLASLLATLRAESVKATRRMRNAVQILADKMAAAAGPHQAVQLLPPTDEDTLPLLPLYHVPGVAWDALQDQESASIKHAVMEDLRAIGMSRIPPTREEFSATVGSLLMQGRTGIALSRISHRPQMDAAQEIAELIAGWADEPWPREQSDEALVALQAWALEFIPGTHELPSGTAIFLSD